MRRIRFLTFTTFLLFLGVAVKADENLLALSSGAVMISHTGEYKETWASMLMLDGSKKRGWASPKDKPFPHSFIIELKDLILLKKFVIDNSENEESTYKGISAKDVRLSARNQPDGEFWPLTELVAEAGARNEFQLSTNQPIRWLKVEVLSNHGRNDYTELMEIEGYGDVVEVLENEHQLNGVFETNYNLILFATDNSQVEGCYDWDNGRLNGNSNGRIVQFEWREDGNQVGTAIMVLAHDGKFINGLWYEKGQYKGLWTGQRVTDRKPKCIVTNGNVIERGLTNSGRVITYGLHFDHDSAQLRADSETTLNQILATLNETEGLRIMIQGHTDSDGDNDYNQILSERRAEAVVNWLTQNGVDGSRLKSSGHGESQPVSDNETIQGKALNRRVELRRLD